MNILGYLPWRDRMRQVHKNLSLKTQGHEINSGQPGFNGLNKAPRDGGNLEPLAHMFPCAPVSASVAIKQNGLERERQDGTQRI
jgi:hypothetical protein